MSVVLQGQSFAANAWGEASVTGGDTATVIEQFSYAVTLSGTLASGDTVLLTEQNAAHPTVTLTCTGLGDAGAFVLADGSGDDFVFSNAPLAIGDQAPVSTAGLADYQPPPPCFARGTRRSARRRARWRWSGWSPATRW